MLVVEDDGEVEVDEPDAVEEAATGGTIWTLACTFFSTVMVQVALSVRRSPVNVVEEKPHVIRDLLSMRGARSAVEDLMLPEVAAGVKMRGTRHGYDSLLSSVERE